MSLCMMKAVSKMTERGKRVLIADDHPAIRENLRDALLASGGVEFVAEAATGDEAVTLAIDRKPDVAILDLRMPGLDGIEAASRIRKSAPATAVLILSLSCNKQYVRRAFGFGVRGYVSKDDAPDCLADAIEAVCTGACLLRPSVIFELQNS